MGERLHLNLSPWLSSLRVHKNHLGSLIQTFCLSLTIQEILSQKVLIESECSQGICILNIYPTRFSTTL